MVPFLKKKYNDFCSILYTRTHSFYSLTSHPRVGAHMSLLLIPWQLHVLKNEEQENGQVIMFVKFLFPHQHYFAN